MKVELDLPPAPEGFRYTGEYRKANRKEFYIDFGFTREVFGEQTTGA